MNDPDLGRPLRVLIVDDHQIVREGLTALLKRQANYEVVAEAGTVAEALAAADRHRPDLLIMDISLPDGSGIETCRDIKGRYPETRIVMLTGSGDEDTVLMSVIAGANGYLLKQSGASDVLRALDIVAGGGSLLDPIATDRVVRRLRRLGEAVEPDPLATLSERERQILGLIAEGKTNKQIAADIFLSEKTVKRTVSVILSRLGIERRTQAAALYARKRSPD
jgi:two-component system, NarL family, response regulator DevR